MLSLETGKPTMAQMDVIQSAWAKIRSHLENEKARIYEAIVHYPTPIAGCDQQFNYLLEEQTRIRHELDRLHEASSASITTADSIKLLGEFIRSSSYVNLETEQTIRSYLQKELSRL
jgi:hypothetical protein